MFKGHSREDTSIDTTQILGTNMIVSPTKGHLLIRTKLFGRTCIRGVPIRGGPQTIIVNASKIY